MGLEDQRFPKNALAKAALLSKDSILANSNNRQEMVSNIGMHYA